MLLNLNVREAIDFIESSEVIREDQVIPGHFRPCPESPYGKGYDWLYRYERSMAAFLEPLIRSVPADLFGEESLFHEVLVNAFSHAHHRNPLKPITVLVMLGKQGLIIQVSDLGRGFNVRKMHRHCRKKRRYLSAVGDGIRTMAASSDYGVFYNQEGTTVHLLYPFGKKLDVLSANCTGPVSEC